MKKTTIDLSFAAIAAIGPVLWIIDAFVVASLFKADFLRQLFFPKGFDLVLCILLIFFPLLVAVLFQPRAPAQEKLEEIKEIENGLRKEAAGRHEQAMRELQQKCDARVQQVIEDEAARATEQMKGLQATLMQECDAKLASERKRIEELVRQEEQKRSQDAVVALQQQFDARMRQAVEEEIARAAQQLKTMRASVTQEYETKVAVERKRAEESARQEEQKKSQDALSALQQKYEAQLRAGLDDQNKRAIESVRLEEQKNADERLKALETRLLLDLESKIVEERKRIEESVRQEEQKKAEDAVRALRQKYDETVRSGQDDERKRLTDMVRMEEQKKMAEQIRSLEEKYTKQIAARVDEERKHIEDAVRIEEQKKAEEAVRKLRQTYEEQMLKARSAPVIDEGAAESARKALEEKYAKELVSRLAEERAKIETTLKQEFAKKEEELKKKAAAVAAAQAAGPAVAPAAAAKPAAAPAGVQVPGMNRIVNGISQQVLNPLNGVVNNIKLLKIKQMQGGDMKGKDVKEALDFIEENAFLCKNILTSMSSISGGTRGNMQQMSVNIVVKKIDALLGHELKLQNISIQKVLQDNLPDISGDAWLLTQMLFNIVSNAKWAIKSNPMAGAGTITITTQATAEKNMVELLVTDNGIGISAENLPHIFEPFFTTKQDGLGLGLTVAQNIVKGHNGDIEVDSKEDKGTTFKIALPVAA